jgi:hypothetical protein
MTHSGIWRLLCKCGLVRRWKRRARRKGKGIALLIPFRTDNGRREETFQWLLEYYAIHLPKASITIGLDGHVPFSKTQAFNNAVAKTTKRDDIFVLLDADCYIDTRVILDCAREIRRERRRGQHLWFIPYRFFIRLTEEASRRVLDSDPANPLTFSTPPPSYDWTPTPGASQGHWWGALIQIMPREAFELAGGMDWRFQGWGGEDVAFMRAVDTLYGRHKTTRNQVLHLWHPFANASEETIKGEKNLLRLWEGQDSGQRNDELANRYYAAFGDPERMRRLVDEYRQDGLE